jgi:SAM-dependent methyltransferase
MEWLLDMLSWPVEWSALHGIAEVRTPILKISTATDATAERLEVRRQGEGYPEEGARGLHFPYRPPDRLRVLSSVGFRRGLQNPLSEVAPTESKEDWFFRRAALFSQNGYRLPPRGMYQAILELVDRPGSILELGCGNGLLLRFLHDHAKHRLDCCGIDINEAAIQTAQTQVFPEQPQAFSVGDVRTYAPRPGQHSLILANPLYADPGYYQQQSGQIQRLSGEGFISQYVERCLAGLTHGGRLILFCYTDQLRQIAPFRELFDRELARFSPRVLTSLSADLTFFLIDR